MAHITLQNGLKIRTFTPPAGFDPVTASDADLVTHGFPSRPSDPRHLDRYNKVMGQLKGKFHYIQPTFRINSEKTHRPRHTPPANATESSTNWSGAVAYAPSGDTFSWIEGDWVVPNVDAPTQNQWYYCASWIGIDGDGSSDVCQAGVECEVYQSGNSVIRNIYPWWEWFPEAEVQITNLAINAGDMVTMLICAGGVGSTTASVFFSNRTSGASTSFTITAPGGTSLVGNSAEWIVEAPTVGGSQSALADYGEVFFSVCEAVTKGGTTVYGGSGNNINMTNSAGTIISDGNLITAEIVQCQYVGPLPATS